MAQRTGNAAGSVRSLGAGKADASATFRRVGDVDAVEAGHVRVRENAHAHRSVLTPALFLERPVEGVGPVLGHAVGEVLARGAPTPRLDDRNAFGGRTLHEHQLALAFAVQLEGERDASGAPEAFLDLQRQDEVGVGGVALTGPHVIAGGQPGGCGGTSATRLGTFEAHAAG